MTATPRIFGETVRQKARDAEAVLCSMDDPTLYGEVLHTLSFAEAVSRGLLTDYKVVVLAVDEASVAASIQRRLTEGSELKLDDWTKIVGCYKALTKTDFAPMCKTIPARCAVPLPSPTRSRTQRASRPSLRRSWRGGGPTFRRRLWTSCLISPVSFGTLTALLATIAARSASPGWRRRMARRIAAAS